MQEPDLGFDIISVLKGVRGVGGGGFCIDFVLRQGEVCVHTKTGPSGQSFSQFWEHQGIRNISTRLDGIYQEIIPFN